jgi:uncharacterized membrane protein YphA (DoxX/SURF4 family)
MNAIAATLRPIPFPSWARLRSDPVSQAFTLLRIGFFALPVLMGIDKFAEVLNDNWPAYLANAYNDIIPGSGQDAMYAVGVVEILAGVIVLVVPRFGGLLVAGWLAGIIASLLIVGGYGDIALRDFGLLLGGLTLFRLAGTESAPNSHRTTGDAVRYGSFGPNGEGSGDHEASHAHEHGAVA